MNIQPNNQTVENCLKQRAYYIDFYQREYVWTKETVTTLLDDVFFTFDLAFEEHKEKDITPEVLAKYNWYYLNIYITNTIEGKEYIVDGQQRLTTLSLIAIKLLKLANKDKKYFENLIDTLQNCIYGKDKFKGDVFWIDHKKREVILQHIVNNTALTGKHKNITEENILNRYGDISKYLDDKALSPKKLLSFIMYFLERLVLVELKIEKEDTPMVFEVINDRGIALKPFEILKGKLIGALDKDDTEIYSQIWEEELTKLKGFEDNFFIDYIKGKYIFKRNAEIEKTINNQYHRYIFENNDIADNLKFRNKDESHVENIKKFIKNNLRYYANLYSNIRKNKYEFLAYNNNINELSGQYQNIIAACDIDDANEQDKIESISANIDRLYMLLNLNGVYNSNSFQETSYQLNKELQYLKIEDYRNLFSKLVEDKIKKARGLDSIPSLLEYERFKTRGYENINKRLLRYFFARIEKYICDNLEESMKKDVHYISTKTGHKTGYHIEHILSRNEDNIKYFDNKEEFEAKRNILGGLLLLYNRDNLSSGNEFFSNKLKTYANGLVWGKSLTHDFYHHTNKRFDEFNSKFYAETKLKFERFDRFDKNTLEQRSRLLYELVKKIWNIDK